MLLLTFCYCPYDLLYIVNVVFTTCFRRLIAYVLCVSELIGYVIYGTVIQEVKTSNLAREVGGISNTVPYKYPD